MPPSPGRGFRIAQGVEENLRMLGARMVQQGRWRRPLAMQLDLWGSVGASLVEDGVLALCLVQPDDDPAIATGAQVYGGGVGFEIASVAYDADGDHGLGALGTGHEGIMEPE